jgi:anti-sigma regulatory factor (Ser/Thr protein kinase)
LTERLKVDIAVEADLFILEYRLKKFLKKVNQDIPSILLVAKELATNILKYGKKGFIEIELTQEGLRIVAEDIGKVTGNSSKDKLSGGLGIGLEVVKKSINELEIERKPGGGTRIKATFKSSKQKGKNFILQVGTASKPHYLEEESGDVCLWKKMGEKYMLFVADVLGHGRRAHEVAKLIEFYVKNSAEEKIEKIYADLQGLLRDTRGCAAFVALVSESMIEYINVGNIKAWLVDAWSARRIMGVGGVVGRMQASPKIFREPVSLIYSTLVVCTDGIKNQFIPTPDIVWIRTLSARDAALKIVTEFSIKEDDATALVARGE